MRFLLRMTAVSLVAVSGLALVASADKPKVHLSFEKLEPGSLPEGWQVAENKGAGTPAKWGVARTTDTPDGTTAFGVLESKNPNPSFNLAILKRHRFRDVQISLKLKAVSGAVDQGGGPMWRVQDADNYYVCRWNPLEKNFRVYHVVNGKRTMLKSADVAADPSQWHSITVRMSGRRIEASFNGRRLLELEDETISTDGLVGLWTKADAATLFDRLEVEHAEE